MDSLQVVGELLGVQTGIIVAVVMIVTKVLKTQAWVSNRYLIPMSMLLGALSGCLYDFAFGEVFAGSFLKIAAQIIVRGILYSALAVFVHQIFKTLIGGVVTDREFKYK